MKSLQTFISAVFAGIAIAFGSAASLILGTDSIAASAAFFCVGLLAVAVFELNLFTDNLGAIFSRKNGTKQVTKTLIILLGNIIGALIIGIAARPNLNAFAKAIVASKIKSSVVATCVGSILCGLIIYIAMHGYRKSSGNFTACAILVGAGSIIRICNFDFAISNSLYVGAACNNFAEFEKNIAPIILLIFAVAFFNIIGTLICSLLNKIKNEDLDQKKRRSHKHSRRHSSDQDKHPENEA